MIDFYVVSQVLDMYDCVWDTATVCLIHNPSFDPNVTLDNNIQFYIYMS